MNAVYAGTVGPDGTLYIGGRDYDESRPGLYAWDGAAWSTVGNGLAGNVWVLRIGPDGTLYAGGEYLHASGGSGSAAVARLDGDTWTFLGTASGGNEIPVFDIAFAPNGDLYAGGSFIAMDGVPARNIARFDGTAWSVVGDPVAAGLGQVDALALGADGALYAGGYGNGGARFDGTAWTRLEAVRADESSVLAFALDPSGDVFVGGTFDQIGGVEAMNLARFSRFSVTEAPGPERASALTVAPNPARGASVLTLAHIGGPLSVEIVDALGRRVGATSMEAPAGTETLTLPTAGLPPGVYVVRVTSGGDTLTRTVTVVR